MTTIFIMAQGQQTRMGGSLVAPKQMLEVAGEPIICRTARLLGQRSFQFQVVVEQTPDWLAFGLPIVTLPAPGTCLVRGIVACRSAWTDDTLFLLGDVIYSRALLGRILDERTDGIRLWGRLREHPITKRNWREMYALRFGRDGAARIVAQESACRNLHDIHERIVGAGEFVEVFEDDYTDDIDYPRDLETLPLLSEAVKAEAAQYKEA